MSYLLFPFLVSLALFALSSRFYIKHGKVNAVFAQGYCPSSLRITILRITIAAIAAATVAVFLLAQFARGALVLAAVGARAQGGEPGIGFTFVLQTAGLSLALLCELAVFLHSCVYLFFSWLSATGQASSVPGDLPADPPKVAVLIPSCDEDPAVLSRSVASAARLAYPNLRVVLVENSRDRGAKDAARAVAAQFQVELLDIPNRRLKAAALNDADASLDEDTKYIAVLDADQAVSADFLSDLVPMLERDDGLAFVQTPQLYENAEQSLLTRAIAQQQMLLYDCVLAAKNTYQRATCYGTNVVLRRAALKEVGGWDETTVTEDITTSFRLHAGGWRSLYVRRAYAFGLAPPTLSGYWRQQRRWALGNTQFVLRLLGDVVRGGFSRASAPLVLEYVWSAGFYLYTAALSFLALWPTIFLASGFLWTAGLAPAADDGARAVNSAQWLYLSLYPLYVVALFFPYVNMRLRGYPLRNLVLLQGLVSITAPVYLKAMFNAVFRAPRAAFDVAPKTVTYEAPPAFLAPQILGVAVAVVTGSVFLHMAVGGGNLAVCLVLVFWSFFHSLALSHYFLYTAADRKVRLAVVDRTGSEVAAVGERETVT